MTFDAYRSIKAINFSTLKHGAKSARAMKHAIDHPDEGDTIQRMVLRANHAAVLEPDYFAIDFAIWRGGDRRGADWHAFKEANEGRTIVKESEYLTALAIRDAIREHPAAAQLLDGARTEHAIQWTDPDTGIVCKARLDIYKPRSHIADMKGFDVDELTVMWRAADLLTYAQLAWYQTGIAATTGETLPCYLIPYEPKAPHDVAVYEVDEDWLEPGRQLCKRLLQMYAACTKSGVWPGRYQQIQAMREPPERVIDELSRPLDGPITD